MTRITAILLILLALGTNHPLQAQTDSPPPYLYYYSQLLGGLIIERADGTDSRQIAADVIPPKMTGLTGPGWSPSGRYFAATGLNYGDYDSSEHGTFLIDTQGKEVIKGLNHLTSSAMEWSPTGEDLVLVVGSISSDYEVAFWLVNAETKKVLAEYAGYFETLPYESSNVIWETKQKQIRFYIETDTFYQQQYFQVTMRFDGTVLKQPTTKAEFETHFTDPILRDTNDIGDNQSVSPSGRYETSGHYPTILHDLSTGSAVKLPIHSQGLVCQSILWTTDEHYLITLKGIARTDSCGPAVLGITDQNGVLWRELGGCTWEEPCIGWLPHNIDVSGLPPGQPKPIQLDPVAYESAKLVPSWDDTQAVRLRCDGGLFDIVDDPNSTKVLFQLQPDQPCSDNSNASHTDTGMPINIAYDPHSKLLAIYYGDEQPVSIWSMQSGVGTQILKLNTYGYELQFTDGGKYLRARNVNAWKIYSVADILAAASIQK